MAKAEEDVQIGNLLRAMSMERKKKTHVMRIDELRFDDTPKNNNVDINAGI